MGCVGVRYGVPGTPARRLDATLITADKKFRDRAFPFDKRVSLLAGGEGN